jgi:hypothetical protein
VGDAVGDVVGLEVGEVVGGGVGASVWAETAVIVVVANARAALDNIMVADFDIRNC